MTDNSISDEDKALFRQSIKGVKPLNKITDKTPPKNKKIVNQHLSRSSNISPPPDQNYYLSEYCPDEINTESVLSYMAHPISKRRFIQLKQGQIPKEGILDLHGLYREDAKQSLINLLSIIKIKIIAVYLLFMEKGDI